MNRILVGIILIALTVSKEDRISDYRLCGDPKCSEPVSLAKTLIRYKSDDARILSFGNGVHVEIYSKAAGSKLDLWGAKINGKRGYVPQGLVREYKIIKKDLNYTVPTEYNTAANAAETEGAAATLTDDERIVLQSTHETQNETSRDITVNDSHIVPSSSTPNLVSQVPLAATIAGSFSLKGVSAESSNDNPPSADTVTKPYEVIDGTTIFYSTDGETEDHNSLVKATPVLQQSAPSTSVSVPPVETESSPVSSHEVEAPTTTTTTGHLSAETEKDVSKNEAGNLIKDKQGSGGETTKEKIGKTSVEEDDEAYVSEVGNESDEEDVDDDEDEDDEDDEESGEDDANGEDEGNDLNDDVPAGKSHASEASASLVEESSVKEAASLTGSDNGTKSDILVPALSTPESSNLQYSEGAPNDTTVNIKSDDKLTVGEDSSFAESDSHTVGPDKTFGTSEGNMFESSREVMLESHSTDATGDEVASVDGNVTSEAEVQDAKASQELLNNSETVANDNGDVSHVEPTVSGEMLSNTVTEVTVNEMEAVPPVGYEAPTENPFLAEGPMSVEQPSTSEETAGNVEELTNEANKKQEYETGSQKIGSSENIIEGGATTTNEHTESRNDVNDLEKGAEEHQESGLGAEPLQENVDKSNQRSSDSITERENSETQSTTPPDSSSGIFSSIADTFHHGYESVSGLFWSSTISDDLETTTSLPAEAGEEVEKTASMNLSAEEEDSDKAAEGAGSKTSSWPSTWGKGNIEEVVSQPPKAVPQTCQIESGVDVPCAEISSKPAMDPYSNTRKLQHAPEDYMPSSADDVYLAASNNTIWFVLSTGVLVALFTLGFIYLEKNKVHSSLVVEVNALKKALQIKSLSESVTGMDETETEQCNCEELHGTVTALQLQLQDSQGRCAELEDKVSGLEKELETATETGLELNKMLGDMLSSQQDSDQLVHNMEDLRKQLDVQEAAMKADLAAKTAENEKLQAQLDKAVARNNQLEADVEKIKDVLEKTVAGQKELQERNELLLSQLSEEQRQVGKVCGELQVARQMLEEANQALAVKDSEVTVLQDCLKQTRPGEGEEEGIDKFQVLLDVGHVRAELKMVSLERDALADRLRGEEGARKLLEDHVELISKEVDKLRLRYEEAEREKLEAQTRLQVLSNYFKEKETQLQKELGLQEAMNLQKDGDVVNTFERIRLLQDEVENYKSQIETLKKEILDQERGLKSQISALEKKAHENWVAARQAERRLEETKQEAGQLRNRLTIVEKNITNTSTPNGDTSLKMTERLASESNGEVPMSPPLIESPLHYRDGMPVSPPLLPPFMLPPPGIPFMPPPGVPFLPPPPPPMYPGDRRPPPLGRMSSPPPRFSSPPPPSDYSPSYDGRSEEHSPVHFDGSDRYRHRTPPLHPPSHRWDQPVGPRSGFRPLPPNLRTTPRNHKGSAVSSGHSSESLEKSSRHSDNNMV